METAELAKLEEKVAAAEDRLLDALQQDRDDASAPSAWPWQLLSTTLLVRRRRWRCNRTATGTEDRRQGQGGGGARDALRFTGTEYSTSGEDARPQRSDRSRRHSSGECLPTLGLPVLAGASGEQVDAFTLRYLLAHAIEMRKVLEEQERRKEEEQKKAARSSASSAPKRTRKKRRKRRLPRVVRIRRCGRGLRSRSSLSGACSASWPVCARRTVARSSSILAVACARLVLLVTMLLVLCFFPCRQGQDALHLGWYGSEGLACLPGRQHPCPGAEAFPMVQDVLWTRWLMPCCARVPFDCGRSPFVGFMVGMLGSTVDTYSASVPGGLHGDFSYFPREGGTLDPQVDFRFFLHTGPKRKWPRSSSFLQWHGYCWFPDEIAPRAVFPSSSAGPWSLHRRSLWTRLWACLSWFNDRYCGPDSAYCLEVDVAVLSQRQVPAVGLDSWG